ncbi:MAG: hypothetical protein WAO20_17250, partial [Acidobacteriota bacterium]
LDGVFRVWIEFVPAAAFGSERSIQLLLDAGGLGRRAGSRPAYKLTGVNIVNVVFSKSVVFECFLRLFGGEARELPADSAMRRGAEQVLMISVALVDTWVGENVGTVLGVFRG